MAKSKNLLRLKKKTQTIATIFVLLYMVSNILKKSYDCLSLLIGTIVWILSYAVNKNMSSSIYHGIIVAFLYQMFTTPVVEGMTNKKRKKKIKRKKKVNFDETKMPKRKTTKKRDVDDNAIDRNKSFLEAYKKLKPNQLSELNEDTQDLIATQKELLETLNTMGPALKEGKQILDSFKGYFGREREMDDMVY